MKRHLRILLTWLCIAAILLCAVPAVADEEASDPKPAPAITHYNLSFDNEVHLLYRLDFSAIPGFQPDDSNCGMLFWRSEPTDPIYENAEERILPKIGTIEGENAYIVKYTNLAAHQMCDIVWSRAYAIVDGEYRYSELVSYSIARYAETMLGYVPGIPETTDYKLRRMLKAMISYGEMAQYYFNYNLEHLPTDFLPENQFKVYFETNNFADIPTQTVCRGRRATEPVMPEREGYEFLGWYRDANKWDFNEYAVIENITLTAHWNRAGEFSDGFAFEPNGDGTCTLIYAGDCPDSDIRIPQRSSANEAVTKIGDKAFASNNRILSVTLPEGIKVIGGAAFADCRNLKTVNLPSTLERICESAFSYCTSLTDLTLPNGLKEIGYGAFSNCSMLFSIVMPDTVTTVGDRAFEECTSLWSAVIPASVTNIGEGLFSGCTNLDSVTVPFLGTSPDGSKYVYLDQLLGSCGSRLRSVTIAGGTEIPDNTFTNGNFSNLEEVILAEGITRIGSWAFGSSLIRSITLPKSLKEIGSNAFMSNTSIYELKFSGTMDEWNAIVKGSDWKPYSVGYVICSDGNVTLQSEYPGM